MSQLQNSTIYCTGAAAWQLCPGCSWRSDFPASRLSPVSANVIVANKTMHVSRYVKMWTYFLCALCARAELFNCYNLDQSFFVPFLHWSSHSLPLHTTHSLAKWNRKEVSKVSTVCRLRMLTSVFITKLCSPHHWPLEVTTKVREDFIQSWRCPLLGPSLLSHLRHYAKCKLTWNWDTLRI